MKANHTSQKYRLEDNIAKHYPQQITILKERISGMLADIQTAKANLPVDKEQFSMKVGDKLYTDKKEAGTALVEMCKEIKTVNAPAVIGEYASFKMAVSFDAFNHKFVMNLKGQLSHNLEVGSDPLGNISRINHALETMSKQLMEAQTKLETVEHQLETAKVEVTKPFAQEAELAEKLDRLSALNALLNMDKKAMTGWIWMMSWKLQRAKKRLQTIRRRILHLQRKWRIQSRISASGNMQIHLQKECL